MKKLKVTRKRHFAIAGLLVVFVLVSAASFLMAGKDKSSAKGFLGVNIDRMTSGDREEFGVRFGVLVTGVSKGEAAEKAGVKKYDVIQYFNDERMRRPGDLTGAVRHAKPGSKATIKIVRDGKNKTLSATLGEAKLHTKHFLMGDNKYIWKGKDGKHGFKFFSKGAGDDHGLKFLHKGDKDIIVKSRKYYSSGGFLGVNLQSLKEKNFAEYFGVKPGAGALITSVLKDTPAAKAGLKAGDVIIKLEGKEITSPSDVSEMLHGKKKGDKVTIRVMRHKKTKTIKAELAKRKGIEGLRFFSGEGDIHIEMPEVHIRSGHGDHEDIIIEKEIKKKHEKKIKKEEKKLKKISELIKKREKSTKPVKI